MIYLGADHGGFELKEQVALWLNEWGFAFEDLGAHELMPQDDYTDYVKAVAERVAREDQRSLPWSDRTKGILVCRSGGGMCIGANRYPNVRAVYVDSEESARHSRTDNDANIISLAGDWVTRDQAHAAVRAFLETEFSHEERHDRRVRAIESMGKL